MLKRKKRGYDDPICHPDHRRPRTRREFLAQGFILGSASVMGGAVVSLGPGKAHAVLSPELIPLIQDCGISTQGAG
ncbi:MAG: general secretion pathway protein GspF, partial [Gammaproteobacteria bacterium]|nr:general secretion pathway protein GspF [Gammaproteobacteria bacterium]